TSSRTRGWVSLRSRGSATATHRSPRERSSSRRSSTWSSISSPTSPTSRSIRASGIEESAMSVVTGAHGDVKLLGEATARPGRRYLDATVRQLLTVRTTLLGLVIIVGLALVAVAAPVLAPEDPVKLQMRRRFQPPSLAHPFGTDEFGRDILTRVIYGARISFRIAIVSVLVPTVSALPIRLPSPS